MHKEDASTSALSGENNNPKNFFYSPQTTFGGKTMAKELAYQKILENLVKNFPDNEEKEKEKNEENYDLIDLNINSTNEVNSPNNFEDDFSNKRRLKAFKNIVDKKEEITGDDNLAWNNNNKGEIENKNIRIGMVRFRSNTDHDDYERTMEKKKNQHNKFDDYSNNLNLNINSNTNINEQENLEKLYLKNKMSTTTEVDLELETKYSKMLDNEEDLSAEFNEIDKEIDNELKKLENGTPTPISNNNSSNVFNYDKIDEIICSSEKKDEEETDELANNSNFNHSNLNTMGKTTSRSRFLSH